MRIGWTKNAILSVGLLILTAACQPSPYRTAGYQGGYVQPARSAPGYERCGPYEACGQARVRDYGRICPPGHRLIRVPYGGAYGQSGRACVPVTRRPSYRYAASSPPACYRGYRDVAPRRSVYDRSYRDARRRPSPRNSCCY